MKHQYTDRDKLIFEYLEKNLADREQSAFEADMESDPILKEDVDLWKLTFVEESFSATPWSDALKIPVKKSKWTLLLNTFMFCSFLLFVAAENSKDVFLPSHERTVAAISKAQPVPYRTSAIDSTSEFRLGNNERSITNKKITTISAKNEAESLLYNLRFEQTLAVIKPPTNNLNAETLIRMKPFPRPLLLIRSASSYRVMSRKELRSINRRKRKQHELTVEKEFQKGNVPYVVPLDLKHF
jgi:hypothetical protein